MAASSSSSLVESPSSPPSEEVLELRRRVIALREAHDAVMQAKVQEIARLNEELCLVNDDIAVMENEERKCKRRLHRVQGTLSTPQTAAPAAAASSMLAGEEHRSKNLVENILSSLLEFNEALSKRR